jgi:hypothetical protein
VDWYNGYSDKERAASMAPMNRALRNGDIDPATNGCMLCGDASARLELHSEDYSKPYRWCPPAAYWLCRHCHRNKLHKRFASPDLWIAFLAHVRRGGYAADLKDRVTKRELDDFRAAVRAGNKPPALPILRTGRTFAEHEWWEQLTLDNASLRDPTARPRV